MLSIAIRELINAALLIVLIIVATCISLNYSYCNTPINHTLLSGTNLPDSMISDTLNFIDKKEDNTALSDIVEYAASDSMRFNVQEQKMYLFGKAHVKYLAMNIDADYIEMDMKKDQFFASGVKDSTGEIVGSPEFKDEIQGFKCQTIRYNFKTKKGKITDAITQEGDGYIHGKEIKRESEDILYIRNGKYTTCNKEEPHFYIAANKIKVVKDKEIITGPAYLVIADVPTLLAVPFGIFPNKKGQSSGIVMPTYGQSPGLGFYLSNGGYYFAMNEYMDITLTGDIYSRGSWGLNALTQYKKRYKYSGNLNLSYSLLKNSDPEFPDYSKSTSFFVKWKHNQDQKARPNSRFSADVNAGSSNNFKNDFSSTTTDYLTNSFNSNISYNYNFPNKPFVIYYKWQS